MLRPVLDVRIPLLLILALSACCATSEVQDPTLVRVLSFNILRGGGDAANVGFHEVAFDGSRRRAVAAAIRASGADVVGVQEDDPGDGLLAALGPGWSRAGNVYTRHPLELLDRSGPLTVCRVHLPGDRSIVVVNAHWRPGPYGPFLVQDDLRAGVNLHAPGYVEELLRRADKAAGPRGYDETLAALAEPLARGEVVVLTGDFNEPSHLDWTARYAREGADRWVDNPGPRALRLEVGWTGSRRLAAAGLRDAWREVHPDEVRAPGDTWTQPYPEGTPGRRPPGDQVRDRIDAIHVAGPVRVLAARVLGEDDGAARAVPWPSDHRAVLVDLALP